MELQNEFGQFVQILLIATVPALAAFAFAQITQGALKLWGEFKNAQPEKAYILQQAAEMAVKAAEQSALKAGLQKAGEKKLAWAQQYAQDYLDFVGLKVDVGLVSAAIEAAVLDEFSKKKE